MRFLWRRLPQRHNPRATAAFVITLWLLIIMHRQPLHSPWPRCVHLHGRTVFRPLFIVFAANSMVCTHADDVSDIFIFFPPCSFFFVPRLEKLVVSVWQANANSLTNYFYQNGLRFGEISFKFWFCDWLAFRRLLKPK